MRYASRKEGTKEKLGNAWSKKTKKLQWRKWKVRQKHRNKENLHNLIKNICANTFNFNEFYVVKEWIWNVNFCQLVSNRKFLFSWTYELGPFGI